jgi:hypothetical protein
METLGEQSPKIRFEFRARQIFRRTGGGREIVFIADDPSGCSRNLKFLNAECLLNKRTDRCVDSRDSAG